MSTYVRPTFTWLRLRTTDSLYSASKSNALPQSIVALICCFDVNNEMKNYEPYKVLSSRIRYFTKLIEFECIQDLQQITTFYENAPLNAVDSIDRIKH